MPDLSLPNTIDTNTTADAVEVQQNFEVTRQFINTDLINRDGSVAMTQQLTLVGDPVDDEDAATKGYVDALLPIGVILPFGGAVAPAGQWALCNGASLASATYPLLFSVLGQRYGGTGGTFKLPNMAARVPVGVDSTQPRFDTTGKTGGSTLVPIPSHTHTINHNHASFTSGAQSATHTHTFSDTTTFDGDHTHNLEYDPFTVSAGGTWLAVRTVDVGTPSAGTSTAVTHTHNVSGTTGTTSVGHTHSIDMPVSTGLTSAADDLEIGLNLSTGDTAASPAVTTTTEHLPPFVAVQYIIRIDQV